MWFEHMGLGHKQSTCPAQHIVIRVNMRSNSTGAALVAGASICHEPTATQLATEGNILLHMQ